MIEYSPDEIWPIDYQDLNSELKQFTKETEAELTYIGKTSFGHPRPAVVFPGDDREIVISAGEDPDELIPVARIPDILDMLDGALDSQITVFPYVERFMPAEEFLGSETQIHEFQHIENSLSGTAENLFDELDNPDDLQEEFNTVDFQDFEKILWDPENLLLAIDKTGNYEFQEAIFSEIDEYLPESFAIYSPIVLLNSIRAKNVEGRRYDVTTNHGDLKYKQKVEESDVFLNFHQSTGEGFAVADPEAQELAEDIVYRVKKSGEPLLDSEELQKSSVYERVNAESCGDGLILRNPDHHSLEYKISWEAPHHFYDESPLDVIEALIEYENQSPKS